MALLSHESVDLDQQDHYGSTPLSIAVRNCRPQIVKALLATGEVAFNSQDRFGRTLWWWARRSRNTDIQQALRDYSEKRGIAICNNDDFIEVSPISNYESSRWCDVCTLSIPENEVFYECDHELALKRKTKRDEVGLLYLLLRSLLAYYCLHI
ncbi:uncharacterized protein BKA55DRAFT_581161, partial [Fusarium redolens]